MGNFVSGDIFQYKWYETVGDIKGVKAYTDDIMALEK